jgi:hypothetical protein
VKWTPNLALFAAASESLPLSRDAAPQDLTVAKPRVLLELLTDLCFLFVANEPRFGGKVLQLYKGQSKGVQLGPYQLNDTARAGYSAEKYLSVVISICSFQVE